MLITIYITPITPLYRTDHTLSKSKSKSKSKSNHHWIHTKNHNHGLKQYKYNIYVHSTSNQSILIHSDSTIHHNRPLHSRVPHTQLRPYEGPLSHRQGSFITDYITGSPLRSLRFKSSNFHIINRIKIITRI